MPNIISYFSFKRKNKYWVHELSNDEITITGEGIFAKIWTLAIETKTSARGFTKVIFSACNAT